MYVCMLYMSYVESNFFFFLFHEKLLELFKKPVIDVNENERN